MRSTTGPGDPQLNTVVRARALLACSCGTVIENRRESSVYHGPHMATQTASDLKIQELEAQLGLLQAQSERASSLEYALIQVQERAQAADAHISYLQGAWWHTLLSTAS